MLATIPGVDKISAINIISEVGVDMSQFPNENHLSSWAGMSPGNRETSGKKKRKNSAWQQSFAKYVSGKRLERHPKKDCYLKRKYESLVARRGKKKAVIAIGHKIIIAVYHVLTNKEAYCEPFLHDNPRKVKKQVKYHLKKLKEFGIVINNT